MTRAAGVTLFDMVVGARAHLEPGRRGRAVEESAGAQAGRRYPDAPDVCGALDADDAPEGRPSPPLRVGVWARGGLKAGGARARRLVMLAFDDLRRDRQIEAARSDRPEVKDGASVGRAVRQLGWQQGVGALGDLRAAHRGRVGQRVPAVRRHTRPARALRLRGDDRRESGEEGEQDESRSRTRTT